MCYKELADNIGCLDTTVVKANQLYCYEVAWLHFHTLVLIYWGLTSSLAVILFLTVEMKQHSFANWV